MEGMGHRRGVISPLDSTADFGPRMVKRVGKTTTIG